MAGRKIKTRQVPVLFEAPLAASLIGSFVHAVSGGALYRKSSFLLDSLGQAGLPRPCFDQRATISAAGLASALRQRRVATRDREVVANGILQGYFLSAYTARKLGMQTTGNAGGCHNLLVRGGDLDFRVCCGRWGAVCWSPNCSVTVSIT